MPEHRFLDGFTASGLPHAARALDLLIRHDNALPSFTASASRQLIEQGLVVAREHCPDLAQLLSEYAVSTSLHTLYRPDAFSAAPLPGYFLVGAMNLLKYESLLNAYPGLVEDEHEFIPESALMNPVVEDMTAPVFSDELFAFSDRLHRSFFNNASRRHVLGVLHRRADEGLALLRDENQHLYRAVGRVADMLASSPRERIFGARSAGIIYALLERS